MKLNGGRKKRDRSSIKETDWTGSCVYGSDLWLFRTRIMFLMSICWRTEFRSTSISGLLLSSQIRSEIHWFHSSTQESGLWLSATISSQWRESLSLSWHISSRTSWRYQIEPSSTKNLVLLKISIWTFPSSITWNSKNSSKPNLSSSISPNLWTLTTTSTISESKSSQEHSTPIASSTKRHLREWIIFMEQGLRSSTYKASTWEDFALISQDLIMWLWRLKKLELGKFLWRKHWYIEIEKIMGIRCLGQSWRDGRIVFIGLICIVINRLRSASTSVWRVLWQKCTWLNIQRIYIGIRRRTEISSSITQSANIPTSISLKTGHTRISIIITFLTP